MKSFQTFFFDGYTFDPDTLKASFFYSFDHDVTFTETIDFACDGFTPLPTIDTAVMETLLFHASLAIGISYYKLYPVDNLVIAHGTLNQDQKNFWKIFYTQGLGEFFFRNNLSPHRDIHFVGNAERSPHTPFTNNSSACLVGLGGGKDSLVSIELLKKLGIPLSTCTFGKTYNLYAQVNIQTGLERLIIQRTIDPKLFEMNAQGYYNGHVPISAIIAFVLVIAAYLYNYRFIVMSNEKSANEGNTVMDGVDINHQRSKSFAFEKDFDHYVHTYLSPDIHYFSLLRGMYELHIAKIFSQYPQYFPVFSSCNRNFKVTESSITNTTRRCCVCPKCAFVYTILRPFLSDGDTQRIFGQELYENKELLPLYKELLGIEGIKPFECVGTNEEVVYAMYLHYEHIKNIPQIPPIMQFFQNEILPTLSPNDLHKLETKLFTTSLQDTNIPPSFISLFT